MLANAHPALAARGTNGRCFHVTGNGPALPELRLGALTRDHKGGEHVSAIRRLNPSSQQFKVSYLVRRPGSHHWTDHRVPGSPAVDIDSDLTTLLSPSGKRVITVIDNCDADQLALTATSIHSRRLPKPTSALPGTTYGCGNNDTYLQYVGAAALPHGKAALLFSDPQSPTGTGSSLVSIGKPGRAFPTPVALPNPVALQLRAEAITRDPQTGELTVVADDESGGVVAWTKQPGNAWPSPTVVAAETSKVNYTTTGVTAAKGRISVALQRVSAGAGDQYDALALVERSSKGHWSPPAKLPRTSTIDGDLLLLANPNTGHLHAAYNARSPHHAGLIHRSRVGGAWSKRRYLTRNFRDEPEEITLTKQGHPIVGYQRT
jgi:hypothetical protein